MTSVIIRDPIKGRKRNTARMVITTIIGLLIVICAIG